MKSGMILAKVGLLLTFFAGMASTAQEPQATPDAVPVSTKPVATRDIDPALWAIKDDDTTIYLFGTIHLLRPGLSWFDEAVKTAFDESDELVLEYVSPDTASAQKIFGQFALADDGTFLRNRLEGEYLVNYDTALKELGLAPAAFDPFDPWAAAVTIQVTALTKNGYDLTAGVEPQLTAAAKAAGKKIGGVETIGEQLGIFDRLPMDDQLLLLNASTANVAGITEGLDLLAATWGKGESEKLGQIMNQGFTSDELKAALLTRRNARWAHWIRRRMDEPGTVFIAVGAGHLAGGNSVQTLLSAYNLKAKRINY